MKIKCFSRKIMTQNEGNMGFEEIFDEGVAVGEARGVIVGEANSVVKFLMARFTHVPKSISDRVLAIGDTDVLDSLTVLSAKCQSLKEFEKALK